MIKPCLALLTGVLSSTTFVKLSDQPPPTTGVACAREYEHARTEAAPPVVAPATVDLLIAAYTRDYRASLIINPILNKPPPSDALLREAANVHRFNMIYIATVLNLYEQHSLNFERPAYARCVRAHVRDAVDKLPPGSRLDLTPDAVANMFTERWP